MLRTERFAGFETYVGGDGVIVDLMCRRWHAKYCRVSQCCHPHHTRPIGLKIFKGAPSPAGFGKAAAARPSRHFPLGSKGESDDDDDDDGFKG